jgi:RecB family exonuclease
MHISFSEMKSFRRCPQQHHYKYNEKLRRKRKAKPLLTGEILHAMLEAKFSLDAEKTPLEVLKDYGKKYKALFREEQEMYGEDFIPDLKRIFEGYERQYKDEELKTEAIEEKIETDLTDDIQFIGYIDSRAVDKHGRRWLIERKTHKTIPDEDRRFSDLQTVLYLWGYNRMNPKMRIDGVMWDYLRSKAPSIPEQLKKGGLSIAKNVDTDYETYLSEIRRLGLNPADYAERLETLRQQENPFFRRVFLPSPPKVLVESVVEDMRRTAILIKRLGDTPLYRNMTHECSSMCEFYSLCQAELRGLDSNFVRKTEYEIKPEEERNGNQKAQ